MPSISCLTLARKSESDVDEEQVTPGLLKEEATEQLAGLVVFAEESADRVGENQTFMAFEKELVVKLYALARTVVVLFLTVAEERLRGGMPERFFRGGRAFKSGSAEPRSLSTLFGVIRYWRTYAREVNAARRRGFHPLDVELGLSTDRFSWNLLSVVVRLATRLSFAQARETTSWFVPQPPATEVIEQATLGFGRHTQEWFETAPPPEADGGVLIVQIDSKGAPTATEQELARRRGKRKPRRASHSPRHRGRDKRGQYGRKQRRKKGDKSKNAKMATQVVMYTLRREGPRLLGPVNRWVYASFAPKKHAFAIARREANKRGFTQESGKLVQLVTDGDPDLARYAKQYFPGAIHTLDIMHAIEKLWLAGESIHREGSDLLREWVEQQKDRLYEGKVNEILAELRRGLESTPKSGPGNKGKRKRLEDVIRYLDKRVQQMNYDQLIRQDLEIGSGAVEGAVKYIIGRRCDHGGMRWIKERAEAIVQLRCIDVNGDWEAFVQFVHDKVRQRGIQLGERVRLQQKAPVPLPDFTEVNHVVSKAA